MHFSGQLKGQHRPQAYSVPLLMILVSVWLKKPALSWRRNLPQNALWLSLRGPAEAGTAWPKSGEGFGLCEAFRMTTVEHVGRGHSLK